MVDTARDFINLSAKEAGILGVGQTLLSEDINDCFTLLRRMMSLWQKKRWLVPMLMDINMPGNGLISNKIGPGQYWNAPRPDKVQSAYIVQLNTGSNPVSLPVTMITSYEDYALIAVKNLPSLPYFCWYDAAYPYGNVFFWPIPNATYQLHLIVKGAINWQTEIAGFNVTNIGHGMTDGVYLGVPLIGGNGENEQGASLDITIIGGLATTVVLHDPGTNYVINDVLGIDSTIIPGGATSNFAITVTQTNMTLDSQFNMPEEYGEAIHYNLALRICAMYKIPATDETKMLAKASLNTIRVANTQIPTMGMPTALIKGRSFNIFNADGF
jgi:hypothetical protein